MEFCDFSEFPGSRMRLLALRDFVVSQGKPLRAADLNAAPRAWENRTERQQMLDAEMGIRFEWGAV